MLAGRCELRRVVPVVDIGDRGPPGPQHGRWRWDVDAGVPRPRPVLESGARGGLGRHGAVNRQPGGLAHVFEKSILDSLLAGRQDQFEVRAVVDVCEDGPGRAVDGLDRGQADRQGQAEEVEVGIPVAGVTAPEDAEGETPPSLGVDRAVEKGAARQLFRAGSAILGAILEDHRQRVMPGGGLCRVADRGQGFGRLERNRRAVRERGLLIGPNLGVGLPEEVLGHELDAPAGYNLPVERTRPGRDGAVAARQAGEAEAGGVLATDRRVVPAVLAEAQQHGGIGDAGAVVGDRDGGWRLACASGDPGGEVGGGGNGNADARGTGAAAVLQGLDENLGQGGGVDAGDPFDGALVDAGADRAVHGRTSMRMRNRKRPASGGAPAGRSGWARGFLLDAAEELRDLHRVRMGVVAVGRSRRDRTRCGDAVRPARDGRVGIGLPGISAIGV